MTPELKTTLDTLIASNKTLTEGFLGLSNQFEAYKAAAEAKQVNAKKEAWDAKLDALFMANKIDALTVKTKKAMGETVEYDLSWLADYDKFVMLANDGRSQSLASGAEPSVRNEPSAEDIAAAIKELAGK